MDDAVLVGLFQCFRNRARAELAPEQTTQVDEVLLEDALVEAVSLGARRARSANCPLHGEKSRSSER